MAIEKMEKVDPSFAFSRREATKISADHSGRKMAQKSDREEDASFGDDIKITQKLEELLLDGADLDGDGVISQREAILANSRGEQTKVQNVASESVDKKTDVKWIDADHSGSRIAQDADSDGFMSLDELQLKNTVRETLLSGKDLDGDGIVSQKEAVLANASSIKGNGVSDARKVLAEAYKAVLDEGTAAGLLSQTPSSMRGLGRQGKASGGGHSVGAPGSTITDAKRILEEIYSALLERDTASGRLAEDMSKIMGCIGFSRALADALINEVEDKAELRVMA